MGAVVFVRNWPCWLILFTKLTTLLVLLGLWLLPSGLWLLMR